MFINTQLFQVYSAVLNNASVFERIKSLECFLQSLPLKYYCFYNEILLKAFNNPISRVTNYPKEWMKTYMEKGYSFLDPAIQESLKHDKPYRWDTQERENPVYKEALERNIRWGLSIPVISPNKDYTLLSMVFETEKELNKCCNALLEDLKNIALLFHMVITNARRQYEVFPLTHKEIKVLGWLHKGKTYKDISELESICFSTVQSHISNIYRKLNVENKAAAIYMGLKYEIL